MPIDYEILVNELNLYLTKNYPDITVRRTDIFENAFLSVLGYDFVPEKCQFIVESELSENLSIYFSPPYKVEIDKFVSDLEICASGEFSGISVKKVDPKANQSRFCVHLSVPFSLINSQIPKILESIALILENPKRRNFYFYLDRYVKKYKNDLTIIRIESLIRKKIALYPLAGLDDVWSAIIQENFRKDIKIKFLKKEVLIDSTHFPNIALTYQENRNEKKISLTRDQIVATLEKDCLNELLSKIVLPNEFTVTREIVKFIQENYHRSFYVNDENNYEIDLGYHAKQQSILEINYGIRELSSYTPIEGGERSRYYIYDKENYIKSLIALKEIAGYPCLEERYYQLNHYIQHQSWQKLEENLNFLVNLQAVGVNVDYIELLTRLHNQAMDKATVLQANTIEIIKKVCENLVNSKNLKKDMTGVYNILFKIAQLRLNQLNDTDEAEYSRLKNSSFIYAQKAGLADSNVLLAEIAGLKLGDTFSSDVNVNPIALVIELAESYNKFSQENARFKEQIAKLEAKAATQANIPNSNLYPSSLFRWNK